MIYQETDQWYEEFTLEKENEGDLHKLVQDRMRIFGVCSGIGFGTMQLNMVWYRLRVSESQQHTAT